MKRILSWALGIASVALVAIQLVPVDRTNPPVDGEVPAPPEVRSTLRRACYDCHSNETEWPWYSRVAPVSWLLAYDVREGRKALNFSTWNQLDTKKQVKGMQESWEEVKEGEMPPWFYLVPHRDARISPSDVEALRAWSLAAASAGGRSAGEEKE
jgi:hypothetical protein